MIRTKSLFCVGLIMSFSGQAMEHDEEKMPLCVQTKEMPIVLPQTFIDASPVLRTIQKDPIKNLKKRALFEDQHSHVIQRVIQDQETLNSKDAVVNQLFIECRGVEDMPYYIVLARRLRLQGLIAEYLKISKRLTP